MNNISKIIALILFLNLYTFANSTNIKAYAIGIFDNKGNGENIQHTRFSKNDYNGTCFSKIVIFSNIDSNDITVTIGNSIGHFVESKSIYNNQKIKIGQEITFKHFNISKGYFEVRINKKLYDGKVFIK